MQTTTIKRLNTPEMRESLKDPAFVIQFAFTKLEDFEVTPFLRDYHTGCDLTHWLEGLDEDRQMAANCMAA